MGSEASSSMILFIAALAAAAIAGGAMAGVIGEMTLEFRERGSGLTEAIGTDIAIVNDPKNVPYDDAENNLTIYVKNTGSEILNTEQLTVLVDGVDREFNATLVGDHDRWTKGTVQDLTVVVDLASGDHRVRAVYTPNVGDTLDFRV